MKAIFQGFKRLGQNFYREPMTFMTSLIVLTSTLGCLVLFYSLQKNLFVLLTRWGQDVQLSVYLKDNVTIENQEKIKTALVSSDLFSKVSYLSKDSALELFSNKMGRLSPALLTDPQFKNPLPASFEAELKAGLHSQALYEQLQRLSRYLIQFKGVEEVSYGQGWVENYASALKIFNQSSRFILILLIAGALFVISYSVRSSLWARRDEIEILELFGATRWMIRMPFVVEGALMGFISGLLALAFSFVVAFGFYKTFIEHLQFWPAGTPLEIMAWLETFIFLILATGMGASAAYMSIRPMNSGWLATLSRFKG